MNGGPTKPLACFEADTKPYRNPASGFGSASHNSGVLLSQCVGFRCHADFRRQGKMSFRFLNAPAPWRLPRCSRLASPASRATGRRRRSGDADPAAREPAAAAHRPERGTAIPQPPARGAPEAARGGAPAGLPAAPVAQPSVAAAPSRLSPAPVPRQAARRLPAGAAGYEQPQIAAPAPIVQEPAAAPGARPPPRRCLRSQPESECPRRAARARRRSVADRQRSRRSGLPAAAGQASRSISVTPARAIRPARCRRRARPAPAPR